MITRSFLIKAKKLLMLSKTFETNKNLDLTQSAADVRPWDMPRFFSVCPLILNPKFLFGGPLF